jgi:hypothetical protein
MEAVGLLAPATAQVVKGHYLHASCLQHWDLRRILRWGITVQGLMHLNM